MSNIAAPEVLEVKDDKTNISKIKMEIENLTIHTEWKIKENNNLNNNLNNSCGLCKRNLMKLPPNKKVFGDISTVEAMPVISIGKCDHMFHSSCIDAFIANGNITCPIDGTPWSTVKILQNNFFTCDTSNLTK